MPVILAAAVLQSHRDVACHSQVVSNSQLEITSKVMAPGAQLCCSYWPDFSYLLVTST